LPRSNRSYCPQSKAARARPRTPPTVSAEGGGRCLRAPAVVALPLWKFIAVLDVDAPPLGSTRGSTGENVRATSSPLKMLSGPVCKPRARSGPELLALCEHEQSAMKAPPLLYVIAQYWRECPRHLQPPEDAIRAGEGRELEVKLSCWLCMSTSSQP
jgi:hypothetical protein